MAGYVLSAKAARALTRLVRGGADATAPTYTSATISPDDFPMPFTVRWSQSENSGEGAWVIWLPDPERLVYYDEEWRTIGQIAAAQTLPSGWYTITGVRDQDRTVYLYVRDTRREGSTGGIVEAGLSRTDSQGGSGGDYFFCGKVAVMEVDSATGARRVKQFINSTVEIAKNGTGGESVVPDDVSTEFIPDPPQGQQPTGDEGKLQIKGFKAGTPHPTTTIAQDLTSTGGNAGHVLFRESDGSLSYKSIGSITIPTSTVNLTNQTVLTGLTWNTSTHKLEISSAQMNVSNGLITSWTPQQVLSITTTNISSIIGS